MRILLAAMLAVGVCSPAAFARKWTDSTGKHTVEAEFMAFKDGKVQLKKDDGTILSLPLEKLSETDQAFVKKAADLPEETSPDVSSAKPQGQAAKGARKPPGRRTAKGRTGRSGQQAEPVDQLLAKIRNPTEGDMPFRITPTRVESQAGAALAAGLVKTSAEFRLQASVALVQNSRQEKEAVAAVMQVFRDVQGKEGMRLGENEFKAICFLATEALFQLSATSDEALNSLMDLQRHPNPVIAAQAQIQVQTS
jgi:hypothetical protein